MTGDREYDNEGRNNGGCDWGSIQRQRERGREGVRRYSMTVSMYGTLRNLNQISVNDICTQSGKESCSSIDTKFLKIFIIGKGKVMIRPHLTVDYERDSLEWDVSLSVAVIRKFDCDFNSMHLKWIRHRTAHQVMWPLITLHYYLFRSVTSYHSIVRQ